ncbi:MAG: DUF480 domain-containing protein [Candidatus Phosphoribacter sp.]|nr:DUF480 domain-containing protein [Actinomycetales bacterium]
MPESDPSPLILDSTEQRVLGSLMEKQRSVPGSYPLSLNALRTACNQATSRDPVVDWDEHTVTEALRGLRQRELVRVVHGDRTLKYHQLLDVRLELADDERALLTVLLLRGPQSAGELKTRTDRLHSFADRGEVEACLGRLADRSEALVVQLPRQPGQHDPRWVHLLGPVPAAAAALHPPMPVVDRESVLADGAAARDARVVAAYDSVATAYALEFGEELAAKPFDAWLLCRVAELAGIDPVVDVGCGPGQVARFLTDAGATVTGVDLSPGMIAQARLGHPEVTFEVGDLRALMRPRLAPAWGAITAWYAVVHLAESELPSAMAGLARVLRPGGWLALATHIGAAVHHVEALLDESVDLDFVLHDPTAVRAAIESAGLTVLEWYVRGPLAGVEPDTERLYVLAQRPT